MGFRAKSVATLLTVALVTSGLGGVAATAQTEQTEQTAQTERVANHALVIDAFGATLAADRAFEGHAVTVAANDEHFTVFGSSAGGSGHVTLPSNLTAGRYTEVDLGPRFRFHVGGARPCSIRSVDLRVDEVEMVGGVPDVLSASFDVGCSDGLAASGVLRWNSTVDFTALAPSPVAIAETLVGTAAEREVLVRNLGTSTVTLPASSVVARPSPLTGDDEPGVADWSILEDGCAQAVLERGEECRLRLRVVPTERGHRDARLVVDDTAAGAKQVVLAALGAVRPPPPPVTSVAETLGRVEIAFGKPDTTDTRIETIVVRRRTVGGTWTDIGTLPNPISDHTRYLDRVTPGVPYEYALVSDGPFGRGPSGAVVRAANARSDLLAVVDGHSLVGTRGLAAAQHWFDPQGSSTGPVNAPAPSPDGRWVAEERGWAPLSQLYKRPSLGTAAAVPLTELPGRNTDPAWSPDGRTIAFTNITGGSTYSVWLVPAAGGTATKLLDGVADPTWERDGQHLIVEDRRQDVTELLRVTRTGVARAIPGTLLGRDPAVSPDGRFLAYSVASRDPALVVREMRPDAASGDYTLTDHAVTDPAWSVDGRRVIASVAARAHKGFHAPSLVGFTVATGADREPVLTRQSAVTARAGAAAPRALGVHLIDPPVLTGSKASIRFSVFQAPAETAFVCSLDGAKAQSCTSPWVGSALSAGEHRLVVTATEPSGVRTVTSHVWRVDATPPSVRVTAPSDLVTLTGRATATYRATDASGIADHDVRYRIARFDGSFGSYVYPDSWQRTRATERSVSLGRGRQICFSVRARDAVGNRSAWSGERCASRPLDDRSLTASNGWSRGTGSSFLDGTITSTRRRGAELTRSEVRARQVIVVATRCASCGTADVFVGSTRVGRLDLQAATTQRQQVIALPVQSSLRNGKLTIRVTSTDRTVAIDGVAFRR